MTLPIPQTLTSIFLALTLLTIPVAGDPHPTNPPERPKTLAPRTARDLSDATCPRGWKITVLDLGAGGINCESPTCSCHDLKKTKCGDSDKRLKEVHLPEGADWECLTAPAGCIWCGPRATKDTDKASP